MLSAIVSALNGVSGNAKKLQCLLGNDSKMSQGKERQSSECGVILVVCREKKELVDEVGQTGRRCATRPQETNVCMRAVTQGVGIQEVGKREGDIKIVTHVP